MANNEQAVAVKLINKEDFMWLTFRSALCNKNGDILFHGIDTLCGTKDLVFKMKSQFDFTKTSFGGGPTTGSAGALSK